MATRTTKKQTPPETWAGWSTHSRHSGVTTHAEPVRHGVFAVTQSARNVPRCPERSRFEFTLSVVAHDAHGRELWWELERRSSVTRAELGPALDDLWGQVTATVPLVEGGPVTANAADAIRYTDSSGVVETVGRHGAFVMQRRTSPRTLNGQDRNWVTHTVWLETPTADGAVTRWEVARADRGSDLTPDELWSLVTSTVMLGCEVAS